LIFTFFSHQRIDRQTIGNYPTFRLTMSECSVCTKVLLTRLPLPHLS